MNRFYNTLIGILIGLASISQTSLRAEEFTDVLKTDEDFNPRATEEPTKAPTRTAPATRETPTVREAPTAIRPVETRPLSVSETITNGFTRVKNTLTNIYTRITGTSLAEAQAAAQDLEQRIPLLAQEAEEVEDLPVAQRTTAVQNLQNTARQQMAEHRNLFSRIYTYIDEMPAYKKAIIATIIAIPIIGGILVGALFGTGVISTGSSKPQTAAPALPPVSVPTYIPPTLPAQPKQPVNPAPKPIPSGPTLPGQIPAQGPTQQPTPPVTPTPVTPTTPVVPTTPVTPAAPTPTPAASTPVQPCSSANINQLQAQALAYEQEQIQQIDDDQAAGIDDTTDALVLQLDEQIRNINNQLIECGVTPEAASQLIRRGEGTAN